MLNYVDLDFKEHDKENKKFRCGFQDTALNINQKSKIVHADKHRLNVNID